MDPYELTKFSVVFLLRDRMRFPSLRQRGRLVYSEVRRRDDSAIPSWSAAPVPAGGDVVVQNRPRDNRTMLACGGQKEHGSTCATKENQVAARSEECEILTKVY